MTTDYALAGLLCHHGDDLDGHDLGPACPVQVKPGRYTRPTFDQLLDAGRAPVVQAVIVELRKRTLCICTTDKGTPCKNRATAYPEPYCGVHA